MKKREFLILVMLLFFFLLQFCSADSATTLSPGTVADNDTVGTRAWNNPTNAQNSDNVYAATDAFAVGEDLSDGIVSIVKNNAIGSTNKKKLGAWATAKNYVSYGNSTDLWDETWTAEDINSADFGVVLSVHQGFTSSDSHYLKATNFGFAIPTGATIDGIFVGIEEYQDYLHAYVDYINITVYYTEEADIIAPTIAILPYARSYTQASKPVNATLNEAGNCLYSLDVGVTNVSMINLSTTQWDSNGNVTFSGGINTLTLYCNDSAGNTASNSTTITISSYIPFVNFTTGTPADGSTQTGTSIFVNVTASDAINVSTFIDFDNSLVGWWRMDETDGSGNPVDYLGRNNGSKNGDANLTDSGYFGKGFVLDGIDVNAASDFVYSGVDGFPSGSANRTVSIWVKWGIVEVQM